MKFKFKAKTKNGEIVEGVREESDRFKLSHQITMEGMLPITITPLSEGGYSLVRLNEMFIRVNLHEKIIFAKNLGSMLSAGLSLSRSLSVLEKQTENIKLKKTIHSLLEDIEAGKSFSQAMSKFPAIFSTVFVAMVTAGEESGGLAESLKTIGEQLEKVYIIRKKISSAMIYPTIVLLAMIIIGVLMLVYVVPTITSTFKDFGAELPLSTKIIIQGSDFLVANISFVFFLLLTLGTLIYYGIKSEKGQRTIDFFLLKMPIICGIVRQVNSATTARTLSSLISSGVTIIKALEITRDVLQNTYYQNVLSGAIEGIQRGQSLSSFFKKEVWLYPTLVGEMVEVGEETGNLPQMLMNVAVFYEAEVDSATKDMSTVIEPFLMLIIGVTVGFFAVAMIQPIYALSGGV